MTDTLHALTSRRSAKFLRGPGPDAQTLRKMFQAAACAPDHGALRPWRYVVIEGPQAIGRLADMAIGAVRASGDPRMTDEKEKAVRQWLAEIPLIVAVAQKIDHGGRIPEQEQLLAAGASVMNLLNAAHLSGFGAFWSTGLGTYVEAVQEALGFDELDHKFLGFLAIGTPAADSGPAKRPEPESFVRVWTGEAVGA
ncbi:FIG002003: Protein YdjA [plant metagenome]